MYHFSARCPRWRRPPCWCQSQSSEYRRQLGHSGGWAAARVGARAVPLQLVVLYVLGKRFTLLPFFRLPRRLATIALFCQPQRAFALAHLGDIELTDNAAIITVKTKRYRTGVPITATTSVAAILLLVPLLPFLVFAITRHQSQNDAYNGKKSDGFY